MTLLVANTLTPLMWRRLFLFLGGNVLIGLLEAAVLIWLFRARWWSIPLMIGANYLSGFAGALVLGLGETPSPLPRWCLPTVENYQVVVPSIVAFCFLCSVLIEWLPVHFSLPSATRSVKRSLLASFTAQVASYACCLAPSHFGTAVHIRPAAEVVPSAMIALKALPYWVYFIDPVDGDVHRMRPDGTDRTRVIEADLSHPNARLLLLQSGTSATHVDLMATTHSRFRELRLLESEFAPSGCAPLMDGEFPINITGWAFNLNDAADLRPPDERIWHVTCRDYSGVVARKPGDSRRIGASSSLFQWTGRNPAVLPGDTVIFELGGQICAWDVEQRRLALILLGQSPIVVPDSDVTPIPEPDTLPP